MSAIVFLASPSQRRRSRIVERFAAVALLASVASCGAASELSSTGSGGDPGSFQLNFNSPYTEIQLGTPASLPSPSPQAGVGGIAAGASFAPTVGGENVTALSQRGQFNPNWADSTTHGSEQLAWGTYWLDMSNMQNANSVILDWLAEPRAEDVWVGLANWNKDRWYWRKLEVAGTLTPPNSLDPFIREADMMLACTILVLGTQQVTLNEIGSNGDPGGPPAEEGLLNENAHLGVNLDSLADYTPSTVFLDVFQTSRNWIPQDVEGGPWDNGHAITVDSDGWVTSLDAGQAVTTLMMTSDSAIFPEGRYICLYEGEGVIEFEAAASVAWSSPGRMGVDITPADGSTRLRIVETNPDDYVRNIRLVMPGYEHTYEDLVFHPDFLDTISEFEVIRFTKWGATVESEVVTWADRTTLNSVSQARQRGAHAGASLERMIDLCNTNLSDAWISIPHLADDNFATQAAALIRDRLNPRLRVYVEYSNEIWNSQFMAADYCRAEGLALGLSDNEFEAQLRFYSQRSQEIFSIFTAAFVDEPERMVRVAAGQGSNPWVGTTIMDWDSAQGLEDESNVADRFDHYASAPYFGGYLGNNPQAADTVNMGLWELFNALEADSLAVNGLGGSTEANALNAADRGISLIAYEGGQHLVGVGSAKDDDDLTDLFVSANRDSRMRDLYADDMDHWTTSGGGLFISFSHISNYTKHGSWGLLESQDQDINDAPKLLGLMDWLDAVTINE